MDILSRFCIFWKSPIRFIEHIVIFFDFGLFCILIVWVINLFTLYLKVLWFLCAIYKLNFLLFRLVIDKLSWLLLSSFWILCSACCCKIIIIANNSLLILILLFTLSLIMKLIELFRIRFLRSKLSSSRVILLLKYLLVSLQHLQLLKTIYLQFYRTWSSIQWLCYYFIIVSIFLNKSSQLLCFFLCPILYFTRCSSLFI